MEFWQFVVFIGFLVLILVVGYAVESAVEGRTRRGCETCKHDWYRSVDAPPDTCLKCGAEEDRG